MSGSNQPENSKKQNQFSGFSKWNQREMSSYVAQQLLYDHMTGKLDSERKRAVEKDLAENIETKKKYAQMQKGITYLEKLRTVEVQAQLLEQIDEPSTYLSVLLKKSQFEKWPQSVKWGIEAFVVLMGIALFLVITPWDKALRMVILPQNQPVILAEIQKDVSKERRETLAEVEKKEKPQFSDDKKDVGQELKAKDGTLIAGGVSAEKPAAVASNPKEKQQASALPSSSTTNAKLPSVSQSQNQIAANESSSDKKTTGGFLYRGQFTVTNVEMIAPKLKEKIIALGGRKAGEVEIGWKKSDSTYYYHFTIPEAKLSELNEFFKTYEDPHLVKEKHPRIMADGIIRLIVTVEEKKK